MAAKKAKKFRRVHYVVSTHWDREWYQTFQDFRRRLVALLDHVLDDLAADRLQGPFTTDGQFIVLEDYLEIRPERRAQVEEYVRTGRLVVGPWYVMPDEWLVSGESLVRNIRLGRESVRGLGGTPSSAGFVCDLFGHVSQLPQILRGFGITGGLVWRGLEPRREAHLIWEGADGSRLVCYRFGRAGYCDYAWKVRRALEGDGKFDARRAADDLAAYLAEEAARTAIPPLLAFDGADHLEHDLDHYWTLRAQAASEDFPYEIVHSTLDAYLAEVLAHEDSIAEVVRGELREPGITSSDKDMQWLIPGVLSSRVWIKQENAGCQTLLCQWAEPVAAMATRFLGAAYPAGYLAVAWRWLLQNHPHDSICGCSIDEVHRDMVYRFAQCRQIAQGQLAESLRSLGLAVRGELAQNELRVLVANPLTRPLAEPVTLTLQIPEDWGSFKEFFGYEPKPAFRMFDPQGQEVPYQLIDQRTGRNHVDAQARKLPSSYKTTAVTICASLHVPSLGYTTLTVREGERAPAPGGAAPGPTLPVRHPQTPGLATSERTMENEILSVMIEPNGTVTLTDKRNGRVYRRLLTFEDAADIGDGWFHGLAVNDQRFVSSACASDVALVSDGREFCQFRVRTVMNVPREFDVATQRRSDTFTPLVIDTLLGLRAGCDRLEVRTIVSNTARDHRLRVFFPSGVAADSYLADGAFDVVSRPVALPADNHLSRELAVETTPQQTWTAIEDGKGGLAVVSRGLMESAVGDVPDRPLKLTLFRSTRRTPTTTGQPEGQLQGDMTFDYWIVPFAGPCPRRRLCDDGILPGVGLQTVHVRARDLARLPEPGALPPVLSLLSVDGPVVTSSVRQVDGALEVRVFNPEATTVSAVIDFKGGPEESALPKRCVRVDLESQPLGELKLRGPQLRFSLKAKEIATFRFS